MRYALRRMKAQEEAAERKRKKQAKLEAEKAQQGVAAMEEDGAGECWLP